MEPIGVNWSFLALQIAILGFLPGLWFVLSIFGLFALRRSRLSETNQALWAVLIAVVPVLGALAFFIVKPVESQPGS
jgi:uncharacterized membrane protein YhaH (DUF805 family)